MTPPWAAIAAVSLETMWEIEEVTRRARTDQLTGLANRVLFEQRLDVALAESPTTTAVIFLDVDDFKAINDTHGHACGDACLRHLSGRARKLVQVTPAMRCCSP